MKCFRFFLSFSLVLMLLLIGAAFGQTNAGIIRGTVTDKNNAAVSGATVRLTNPLTKYVQETATDNQGAYRLIDVPPNDYKLTVETTGFEAQSREIIVRSNLAQ